MKVIGWERVADAGACDFCQELDGAMLASADAMALHNGCGCGIEPVVEEGTKRGAPLQHVTEMRADEFQATPIPDTVAVNEHGEMGQVLGAAGDAFTSEADL
jgi:hypothetical protein